jgi:hypothetical protein
MASTSPLFQAAKLCSTVTAFGCSFIAASYDQKAFTAS